MKWRTCPKCNRRKTRWSYEKPVTREIVDLCVSCRILPGRGNDNEYTSNNLYLKHGLRIKGRVAKDNGQARNGERYAR